MTLHGTGAALRYLLAVEAGPEVYVRDQTYFQRFPTRARKRA